VEQSKGLRTLIESLNAHALAYRNAPACTLLDENGEERDSLSFGALRDRSVVIADALRQTGEKEQRVLLLYPLCLEYIAALLGCFYAGFLAIPVPYARASANRTVFNRIRSIVADCTPSIVLTDSSGIRDAEEIVQVIHELKESRWIDTSSLLPSYSPSSFENPDLDDIAFLQYTSGSISNPKGVMVSFGNLACNHRMLAQAAQLGPGKVSVSWLPLFHDMGLIGSLLGPLSEAMHCVLISPSAFLQRPNIWLEAITRYSGYASASPNFGYELCARKVSREQLSALDLSSWRVAVNGSEPIRPATLDRFADAFSVCGFDRKSFFLSYGLAEACLFVSASPAGTGPQLLRVGKRALSNLRVEPGEKSEDEITLAGCGNAWADERIEIVDPETHECSGPRRIGEIWISGDHVARGYWNNPQETLRTFHARVTGGDGQIFLRTGDLGFVDAGSLYIAGRQKDLIIVDGSNHFPQDVELTAEESHSKIRSGACAAFSVDIGDRERLVVVAEVDRTLNPRLWLQNQVGEDRSAELASIICAVRSAVAAKHGLQAYRVVLISPFTIPKTSSGKLQRKKCRESYLSGGLNIWGVE
jgi:acyl-CoA synthetase (AMP-forming)/AMP-acid ligase II